MQRHPVFERHGDDIYLQKDIAFTTAALGGKADVPSLRGNIKLDIPKGTQTETISGSRARQSRASAVMVRETYTS